MAARLESNEVFGPVAAEMGAVAVPAGVIGSCVMSGFEAAANDAEGLGLDGSASAAAGALAFGAEGKGFRAKSALVAVAVRDAAVLALSIKDLGVVLAVETGWGASRARLSVTANLAVVPTYS